jgi:uncharacterized protein
MKRDIYKNLLEWKKTGNEKPLLLLGARQTGKTYILKEFARKEYESLVYCNFEEDPSLFEFFKQDLVPSRIIKQLSIYKKKTILPGKDLIFFDEIQLSNEALNSLKYFNEEAAGYDIAAAGSLLGVKLSKPGSFPVGKVTMLSLYPMTFPEFLTAMGEGKYRDILENIEKPEPFPEFFHSALKNLLMSYYFVGGMPEAVSCFSSSGSYDKTRFIQDNILKAFVFDFAKHAPHSDTPKLSLVWDSIPSHLSKENKKFMFSALSKSARGRDYENALRWLEDTGLIYLSYAVESAQKPLAGFCDKSCFKVYCLDVGLLGAMARITPEILTQKNKLFDSYKGAFVENYAAQQMVESGQKLFYWKSSSNKAEIDFLYESPKGIYPFEIKAGINPKSKSLHSYNKKFSPNALLRSSLLNLKRDGQLLNIPLYALNYVEKYINQGFA